MQTANKMMMNALLIGVLSLGQAAYAQEDPSVDPTEEEQAQPRVSISTVWLTFSNFGNPATNTHHYELRVGYQLTPRDHLGVKFTTWKLFAPMGIDLWQPELLDPDHFYPGRLRERGIGLTYQRRVWKELFLALEVLPLSTTYLDESGRVVGTGFKLYNSYHLGYHVAFLKSRRVFIEPQLHVNHWPINTNVPEAFSAEEEQWGNVFLVEPNLYLGVKF